MFRIGLPMLSSQVSSAPDGQDSPQPPKRFTSSPQVSRTIERKEERAQTRFPMHASSSPQKAHPRSKRTLTNPMSWLFSLKHWRHRFSPYLRIKPALWVQTRLFDGGNGQRRAIKGPFEACPVRCAPKSIGRGEELWIWETARRTRLCYPCRRCAGASTTPTRGTLCVVVRRGESGIWWCAERD